jgi:hypothetical protein
MVRKRQEISQEFEQAGRAMRGRKPEMNWQESKGQYTTTIDGHFYRLGTDEEKAGERFQFLLQQHDLGESSDGKPPAE